MPIASDSVDLVLSKAVSHHLDDDTLPALFGEAARILKFGGRFVFCDAMSAPRRWRSRTLWRYDRGSFPRAEATIRQQFDQHFATASWERFAVHHEYVIGVGTPIG